MTKTSREDEIVLQKVPCIYYPLYFRKDTTEIKALFKFGNKVNTIILAYIAKISLKICSTNIKAQKIDGFILNIFEIVFIKF